MRSKVAIASAALIAAAGLAVAGCGSSSPVGRGNQAPHSPAEAAFAFTRCMRAHGADVPDPHVSINDGQTSISQMMPASAAAAPSFRAAQKACAYLQPGPRGNVHDRHGPSSRTLLAFARCLRGHGLSGFPDPDPQGQLTPQMLRAAGIDVRGPAFFTAAKQCVAVTHGQITLAQVAAAARGAR
jgi:hypothetical protein